MSSFTVKQSEQTTCHGTSIGFGMMQDADTMLVFHEIETLMFGKHPSLIVEQDRRRLYIHFHAKKQTAPSPTRSITRQGRWPAQPQYRPADFSHYKMEFSFAQIISIQETENDSKGGISIVLHSRFPPQLSLQKNHWFRQTSLDTVRGPTTKLVIDNAQTQFGRWLCYKIDITDEKEREAWEDIKARSPVYKHTPITISLAKYPKFNTWLDTRSSSSTGENTSPSKLLSLASTQVYLPYEILYQLEACISQGCLLEANLTHEFATKLAEIDIQTSTPNLAQYLLEYIAASKQTYYNPMDIFKLQHEANCLRNKPPPYCVIVQSVTITPTTMYINTPTVEMSNRILRQYTKHDRHFLRVKFRDEEHLGRIRASDFSNDDAVFNRIKYVLDNGITIAGRTFHFLAYGNSQLREGGAYFFAPTAEVSTGDMRRRMGTFDQIKIVAKYASRLGQCFSTTRASSMAVDIVSISDIERNGYCFTDGAGKMSEFVSRMIAEHLKLPSTAERYPSAYQIRMGGYKGIIVVDPTMNGKNVHLRPSQNKFPADHRGLEICKAAQYSSSFLNQQIILIMDMLGVSNNAILQRQRTMVLELKAAMNYETQAKRLLLKTVDQNQTTLQLASMIDDGFMESKEPFFTSCLHLWQSWTVKTLKEKARVLIPDGAFLLGCVDETASLKGHFNTSTNYPEIFVQICTVDANNLGKLVTKIVQGLCIVARNPSLHPGDIRVVRAVDVPALHHLRNLVVFPQTGDRDIPSMCSGGDLDGDDFLVIWDEEMILADHHHEPMDYTAPAPKTNHGPITINDISTFFVEYMRNDQLGRIASAHRFLADQYDAGVKHKDCLELAALHSMAVDYAKTGVAAKMPRRLKANKWPLWAGKTNVPPSCVYESNKILHRLYREVNYIEFKPCHEQFDQRILNAYDLSPDLLEAARKIKKQYDVAVRRLMDKHEIKSEHEVWTTFVLKHNDESTDWNLAEALGNAMNAIRHTQRQLVYEAAGTTEQQHDTSKLGPFIAAMYAVTAQDAAASDALVSFPWLFQRELGLIANGRLPVGSYPVRKSSGASHARKDGHPTDAVEQQSVIKLPKVTVNAIAQPDNKQQPVTKLSKVTADAIAQPENKQSTEMREVVADSDSNKAPPAEEEEDSEEEVVVVTNIKPLLDRFAAMFGPQ